MLKASRDGIELLQILALSIRRDQDYGLTDKGLTTVGALRSSTTQDEVTAAINDYRPPYDHLIGSTPLGLRQALNKIAHADPTRTRSGFFANDDTHDLVISGADGRGRTWIAVISLIDLCRAIRSLPDAGTSQGAGRF